MSAGLQHIFEKFQFFHRRRDINNWSFHSHEDGEIRPDEKHHGSLRPLLHIKVAMAVAEAKELIKLLWLPWKKIS